ncbi:MAG: hypothetical protein ACK5LJ_13520 [Paracoccus sp. (in: a-proteobacteria)]
MIGDQREGRNWAQASGASLVLHAAVLGLLFWRPAFDFLDRTEPVPLAQIEITTLSVPTRPELPQTPAETVTETAPDSAQAAPGPETITSAALPELSPDPAPPPPSETIASGDPEVPAEADPAPAGIGGETPPGSLPVQVNTEAEAPDPRLLDLIARIRDRLTEPCMLALPMRRGEGELQLSVLSDNDRNITALTDDLLAGIEGDVTREAVLLDPRQCAAVAFARRDPRYPVFALGLQLDSQNVARGEVLRGQITNGAGYYQTLLLVDENGVVHDMRRFLVSSSQVTRIDFPVARWRAPRDTHQLLIALATPNRPQTVSTHAGEAAEPFFDALFAEIGQNALIGISSFYTP